MIAPCRAGLKSGPAGHRRNKEMRKSLLVFTTLLLIQPTALQSKVRAQTPSVSGSIQLTPAQTAELGEATRLSKEVVDLYKQRKYDEALPLAKRVVGIRQGILGEYDGLTAAAIMNLAEIYLVKRDYSEAEKLYEQLLTIYEKVFGKGHINSAIIVESLALVNYFRGNFKSAETLYLRALAIKENALGAENPDVAQAAYELAEFYRSRGDYKKAEPLFLRAIAINDKTIAKDNSRSNDIIQRYVCFLYESKSAEEGMKRVSAFWAVRKANSDPSQFSADRGEVLNGKAISLPAPVYPSEARAIRASGVVLVQVTIDISGKVIDAKVLCGHPVFSKPCLEVAYTARFTATKLSGQPVQVNGIIVYNFVSQ